VDEFYADLSGMDRLFGCYRYATDLRQLIIKDTGLPISIGMSSNKITSKIATGAAKPNNQIQILQGLEKGFLAPLSIQKIPSVGPKAYQSLRNVGVSQIKVVEETPLDMMYCRT